jgi:hypothetical protein
MLGLGRDIDLDAAPIVLRRSRLLGVGWVLLGLFLGSALFLARPGSGANPLCWLPAVLMGLLAASGLIEGLKRLIIAEKLVISERGLLVRTGPDEHMFRWQDIGEFTPTHQGVAFSRRRIGSEKQGVPLLGAGYWIGSYRLAKALIAARQRWAAGAPEPTSPPLSTRWKVALIAGVITLIGFGAWMKIARPTARCWDGRVQHATNHAPVAVATTCSAERRSSLG